MADYDLPDDLRYSREDEWVRIEDDRVTVGISDYAQQQLGDIVFVELPNVGASISAGDTFGVVESVKAVSDLFAPVGGTIVAVNDALVDAPEQVNEAPYGDGWMIEIELDDESELEALMDAAGYTTYLNERDD